MPSLIYQQFKQALLSKASPELREDIMGYKKTLSDCDFSSFNGKILNIPSHIELILTNLVGKNKFISKYENYLEKGENKFDIYFSKPITLEDIMVVLEDINNWEENGFIQVDTCGVFSRILPDKQVSMGIGWQLGKPANLQSDDTLKALINILS